MKIIKYLFFSLLIAAFAVSCNKGLDSINPVDPGTDEAAPELTISYPTEGKIVRSPDSLATVFFKFLASDDFELKSVIIQLDGTEIGNITKFTDYRRLDASFKYSELNNGVHTLVITATDLTDKSVTQSVNFIKITTEVYVPLDGEVLYFPFDGDYKDAIAEKELTVVGTPDFVNDGKVNLAYVGDSASYMTYPTDGILGTGFGVAFWYKLNATPLRAGVLAISPPGDSRNSGIRFLRENSGAKQNFGINFGIGTTEVWMNPFITVDTLNQWIHFAISISETSAVIYVDGVMVKENLAVAAPISWADCTSLSIASGAPNFTYWEHFSDKSLYDEMHIFKRAITAEEVQSFYAVKK